MKWYYINILFLWFLAFSKGEDGKNATECKDRLPITRCTFLRHHMACQSHAVKMNYLCSRTCGGCITDPKSCLKTKYGCCRDGKTPAAGRFFKGCKEECEDVQDAQTCQQVKAKGRCHYRSIKAALCRKTCGLCRPCQDVGRKNCQVMAKLGHCNKKKFFAFNNCRKTCQTCGMADPCYNHKCGTSRICQVDNDGKAYCACKKYLCNFHDHMTGKVCSRTNIEYKNLCYLKIASCSMRKPILAKHYGGCIKQSSVSRKKRFDDPDCHSSTYGCCLNMIHNSKGPNMEGCPKTSCKDVLPTKFCHRFKPDCGASSLMNAKTMQRYCPKTCCYCNDGNLP